MLARLGGSSCGLCGLGLLVLVGRFAWVLFGVMLLERLRLRLVLERWWGERAIWCGCKPSWVRVPHVPFPLRERGGPCLWDIGSVGLVLPCALLVVQRTVLVAVWHVCCRGIADLAMSKWA